jgi:hypothetical protein
MMRDVLVAAPKAVPEKWPELSEQSLAAGCSQPSSELFCLVLTLGSLGSTSPRNLSKKG